MSVQSQIDRINVVKNRIRTNLAAQGVTVPADTTLDEMATLILSVAGYTPVKYVDYWTPADQEYIVQQVITALGTPVFGTVDADNNIILTGELADGTYTIKYEDAEGNQTTIGTLTAQGAPTYTNQIPSSINADGTPYNGGKGWKTNTRLNSSGAEAAFEGWEVTGFIKVTANSDVYLKNVDWDSDSNDKDYMSVYDASFQKIASTNFPNWLQTQGGGTFEIDDAGNPIYFNTSILVTGNYAGGGRDALEKMAYIRISACEINDTSIITVDEPIE